MKTAIFNVKLLPRFFSDEPGAPHPKDKEGGVKWAEEIAEAISVWTTIDLIVIPMFLMLYALSMVSEILAMWVIGSAIAIPLLTMVLYVMSYVWCGTRKFISVGEVLSVICTCFRK